MLLADYGVSRGQLDGLWAYVGNKGEKKTSPATAKTGQFWRSTMIDMDSRLPGGTRHRQDGNRRLTGSLPNPERPRPSRCTTPDDVRRLGGITEAMVDIYGQVPAYQGCGRPPTRKQPQAGWQYLQFVKHRDEHGRLLSTKLRVVFGEPDTVLALFGKSTAYIERTHLTMRHFNGRLVRQTLGFSKGPRLLLRLRRLGRCGLQPGPSRSKRYGKQSLINQVADGSAVLLPWLPD